MSFLRQCLLSRYTQDLAPRLHKKQNTERYPLQFTNTKLFFKLNTVLAPLILLAALEQGCRFVPSLSQPKDMIAVSPDQIQPNLGSGYDSLSQWARDSVSCVNGTVVKSNSGMSDTSFTQTTQTASSMREFTGQVKGTPRILFTQSNFAAGFYKSEDANSSVIELLYTAKVLQNSEKLSEVSLKSEFSSQSSMDLFFRCGDEYIAQINRGGLLTISLKLDFGSQKNREKWQNVIQYNGSLRDFSVDIKNKSEKDNLSGLLSINVHQVGGNPSHALLAAKSCSVNNSEELSLCIKQMDDLTKYAAENFPGQVETNPAVLNYITVPLSTLGVRDLPAIDVSLLQIRKDLEYKLKSYESQKSMFKLGREKGFDPNETQEKDVDFNVLLVNSVAESCFNYQMTPQGPNWQKCLDHYQGIENKLRPTHKNSAKINYLAVDAKDFNGASIINNYQNKKMTVAYIVDQSGHWNYGTNRVINFMGGENCDSSCFLANAPKGAMVLRQTTGLKVTGPQGVAEIYPGEAASFLMNDQKTRYNDNIGAITVFWRCLDCNDQEKNLTTTNLLVSAADENGAMFINRSQTKAQYKTKAYGQWTNAPGNYPWSDAYGLNETCGDSCPIPTGRNQQLVIRRGSGEVVGYGVDQTLTLNPGETVTFIANDDRGGYRNNSGELLVILQCQDCP